MASKAHLPPIICSSCLSFIGHKYLEYKTHIKNDYSKLDTLDALSVSNYCCRMLIENAIVVSTNYGDEYEKKKKINNDKVDEEDSGIVIETNEKYFDTLTRKYKEGSNEKPVRKTSIRDYLAEKRDYKAPVEKIVDLDLIHEETLFLDVGYSKPVKKISKVYIASME